MSPFLKKMEDYGVNIQSTLERFVGNENLYKKCLTMLVNDTNLEKLKVSIAQEDYNEAFNAAHALKGAVGNLGLDPLYNAICDIVEPLREQKYDNMKELYAAIEKEYEIVVGLQE